MTVDDHDSPTTLQLAVFLESSGQLMIFATAAADLSQELWNSMGLFRCWGCAMFSSVDELICCSCMMPIALEALLVHC